MSATSIPNIITIIRIILTPVIVTTLLSHNFTMALYLFMVAGISDGLDGFLAKQFNWQTRLGAILDPLADKFMLVLSYVVLGYLQLVPLWLVFIVLIRDVIIVAGAVGYHYGVDYCKLTPTITSKINTFLQIMLVLLVIFWQIYPISVFFLKFSFLLVAFSTTISGIYYVWIWTYKAINTTTRNNNETN
ncbi:MAG: CDP-alcohol phosphatidyltransferase family protein [Gammaproteobacteria bacterium]|nr:MAG: CDP-alcohol phosphatidyltransferase family protein [Gammaproteobacteria bacterium]